MQVIEILNEIEYFKNYFINTIFLRKAKFSYNDGGRLESNIKGELGNDCVTRALALGLGLNYKKVYDDIYRLQKRSCKDKNIFSPKKPTRGVSLDIYEEYLLRNNLKFNYDKINLSNLNLKSGSYICLIMDGRNGHTFFVEKGIMQDIKSYADHKSRIVAHIKL